MATAYVPTTFQAANIRQGVLPGGLLYVAGNVTEGDSVTVPFKKIIAALCTSHTALAADTQLYASVSSQTVTFTDAANSSDTIGFLILGY